MTHEHRARTHTHIIALASHFVWKKKWSRIKLKCQTRNEASTCETLSFALELTGWASFFYAFFLFFFLSTFSVAFQAKFHWGERKKQTFIRTQNIVLFVPSTIVYFVFFIHFLVVKHECRVWFNWLKSKKRLFRFPNAGNFHTKYEIREIVNG